MTNFKNNYSELLLLANEKITFTDLEQNLKFELVPMSLRNVLFNQELAIFLNYLDTDLEEVKKSIKGYDIDSHYDYLLLLLSLGAQREDLKPYSQELLNGFEIIVPGVNFVNKQLNIYNFPLDKKLFNEIVILIYKILGKEWIVINPEDDKIVRREKEIKIKVQRIKSKGKKSDGKKSNFEDNLAAILYEFPQYKLQDLFDLNIYTFYYLFRYIGKIATYEVSKIAAGNGLTKKHKYFIEK